jgi:predicted metal-dependent hydrolase
MTLDEIKAVVSEHFTNYVVVVLDDETGCLDYRFNNDKIGKMLLQEARSDIISYEVEYDDVEWDEEEVEGDEF